jgi:hypothetical protein
MRKVLGGRKLDMVAIVTGNALGPSRDMARRSDVRRPLAMAWVTRSGNVIAIPESGSPAHVRENAVALSLTLMRRLGAPFRTYQGEGTGKQQASRSCHSRPTLMLPSGCRAPQQRRAWP